MSGAAALLCSTQQTRISAHLSVWNMIRGGLLGITKLLVGRPSYLGEGFLDTTSYVNEQEALEVQLTKNLHSG